MASTDSAPDELSDLLSHLDSGNASVEADSQAQDDQEGKAHGAKEESTSPNGKGERLLAGRYKSASDLEKGYLDLRKGFDTRSSRLKQLEEILRHPGLATAASTDPEIRLALAKAGLEFGRENLEREAEAEKESGDEWDGDENDPRFQVAVLRQEMALERERQGFLKKLGRELTDEEQKAVIARIQMVPDLTWEEAWKLTSHYEKAVKSAHEKAMDDLRQKSRGNRPLPISQRLGGQSLNLKKPVTEMNDSERAAFISDLMEKHA